MVTFCLPITICFVISVMWSTLALQLPGRVHPVSSVRPSQGGRRLAMQGGMFDFMKPSSKSGGSNNGRKGKQKYVVVTGTTSGLGRTTVKSILSNPEYAEDNAIVICANRNVAKAQQVHEEDGLDPTRFKCVELDLGSFASTRAFAKNIGKVTGGKPVDRLCCNAAVYQPALPTPKFTSDGIEEQLQINHLSHFLLVSLLFPMLKKAQNARVIIVGSITGNTNTIGGGLVLPFANLGDLEGMEQGGKAPIAMIDGKAFNGAKAYKDSKICNMMTVNELHTRYHDSTGIIFGSIYPGCIAETQLFREKRAWFQKLFPLFMKYVTGGYVSEDEAGDRLAQALLAPETEKSGVYWSWNGGAREVPKRDFKRRITKGTGGGGGGRESIFENTPSDEVADEYKSSKMWELSTAITGAKW